MSVGTGLDSKLLLKEQSALATLGTGQRSVWLRRHEAGFHKVPNYVTSDYAASSEIGISKQISHFVTGRLRFELDMSTIVDVLKWFMGSITTAQQGATSEYKHTLKFGTAFKYFKALIDEGGMSSALYKNYIGNAINSFSLFVPRMDTVYCDCRATGQTNETGSDPGTPSFAVDELTVAFNGFKVYVGTAGATTIAAMSQWKDPFSAKFDMSRDLNADNFQSDQLGYTDDIVDGKVRAAVNFVTKLRTTHRIADFEAGTETSLGIVLDTGVAIPSGNGSNYKMEIVFPRGVFTTYERAIDGEGTIEPVVDFIPMIDKTATYSVRIDVYNNTTTYPNAT
jgi:hypothetical protein